MGRWMRTPLSGCACERQTPPRLVFKSCILSFLITLPFALLDLLEIFQFALSSYPCSPSSSRWTTMMVNLSLTLLSVKLRTKLSSKSPVRQISVSTDSDNEEWEGLGGLVGPLGKSGGCDEGGCLMCTICWERVKSI